MKRISQIFTLCVLGSMLVACGDKPEANKTETTKAPEVAQVETVNQENLIQTEATQLKDITERQIQSDNFKQLFTAISEAKTVEEQRQVFANFVALFKANKQQILTLELKTKEVQDIRNKLVDGLDDFIQLMQFVAENAGKQLTEEQQAQIGQLQQSSQEKINAATAELTTILAPATTPAEAQ
ncbi:hypothetical protein CEP49_04670 [Mergibacter septicus]|uniref:hypothetical protein n=1 Tax=Mergibacter septicus TaxID=221402 RepID=UPI0011791708|nr:hypothetical protein [Mergibacter septicus]AWX13897.1 hypothetical protein CEP49_04670 [Mergibacter septicus]